eukprot:5612013-Alexandrium_andersonii.AAC.1
MKTRSRRLALFDLFAQGSGYESRGGPAQRHARVDRDGAGLGFGRGPRTASCSATPLAALTARAAL